jgi:hypothetical protein
VTASRLRALTVGPVLSCSPVVICDERGRRFEIVTHAVTTERATDKDGKEVAAGVPVLTLVVRELKGDGSGRHVPAECEADVRALHGSRGD